MKNHFPLLDPLRFGTALGVAIFHQMFWSWAWVSIGVPGFERYVAADVLYPSAAPFTWFGWVGVEIFFVISGFVIANSASKSSPTEFLLGRALRLYPAVWVCATATLLVLVLFGSGPASEFILPYIHAMLLVPKGVTGQWLDGVYWTLAAETAFYGLVFCAMLTKKITLRHLALGPHHLQRGVQRCRVAGAVMHDAIRLALSRYSDVSGAVRSILVDPWLLFCAGHLAFHFRKQKIDGARTGRRRRHVSFGCRRNLLFCLFLFDVHTRHLGSISPCADHGLGGGGGPHCLVREQEQALCSHRFA